MFESKGLQIHAPPLSQICTWVTKKIGKRLCNTSQINFFTTSWLRFDEHCYPLNYKKTITRFIPPRSQKQISAVSKEIQNITGHFVHPWIKRYRAFVDSVLEIVNIYCEKSKVFLYWDKYACNHQKKYIDL